MLSKEIVIDQITVLEDGQIQVRQVTRLVEDGVQLAFSYHRHVLKPGESLTNEDARVITVATAVHTPTVIADFRVAEIQRQLDAAP